MIIAGIDYSYTSPAICVYDTKKELKFENLQFFNYYIPKKKKGFLIGSYDNIHITAGKEWTIQEERFANIVAWSSGVLTNMKVEEVVIEGYSMGSKGGMVFDIAENTSLLKNFMYHNDIPFHKMAPTAVKKSFCGAGNAKKEQMVEKFEEILGVKLHKILGVKEMAKPIDDLCDSFANMKCHPIFNVKEEE